MTNGYAVNKDSTGWIYIDNIDQMPEGYSFSETQPVLVLSEEEKQRLVAHALSDTLTGSDRLFAKAYRLLMQGDSVKSQEALIDANKRYVEIMSLYE